MMQRKKDYGPICEYRKTPKAELINKIRDLEVEVLKSRKELDEAKLKIRYPMKDTLDHLKNSIEEKQALLAKLHSLNSAISQVETNFFIVRPYKSSMIVRIPRDYFLANNISPIKYYKVYLEEVK